MLERIDDTKRSREELQMLFKLRDTSSPVVRPRVTPDPQHAAELEKRFSELAYNPENGFHRDQRQDRRVTPRLTLVPR